MLLELIIDSKSSKSKQKRKFESVDSKRTVKEMKTLKGILKIIVVGFSDSNGRIFYLYRVSDMTKTELKVILKLIDLRTSISNLMSIGSKIMVP